MSKVSEHFCYFRERLIKSGVKIKEHNQNKPWGEFIVIDPESTSRFVELFFPEKEEELMVKDRFISPKVLFVKPESRLSWQYHFRRSELWKLVEGEAAVVRSYSDIEGEPQAMTLLDLITINNQERHRLVGLDSYGIVAEIWQHEDERNLSTEDDIVRLADDYNRNEKGR